VSSVACAAARAANWLSCSAKSNHQPGIVLAEDDHEKGGGEEPAGDATAGGLTSDTIIAVGDLNSAAHSAPSISYAQLTAPGKRSAVVGAAPFRGDSPLWASDHAGWSPSTGCDRRSVRTVGRPLSVPKGRFQPDDSCRHP
jgi:hypothetical protein